MDLLLTRKGGALDQVAKALQEKLAYADNDRSGVPRSRKSKGEYQDDSGNNNNGGGKFNGGS